MINKKIIILVLVLVVMTVVSGCGKKVAEPVINNNKQIVNQKENYQNEIKETEDYFNEEDWKDAETIYLSKDYDYTGWHTYVNEKLGYKIKYPADWIINACDEGCSSKEVIINPPDAEMFFSYISIGLESRNIKGIRSVYLNPINYGGNPYEEKLVIFVNEKAYLFFDSNNFEYFIVQNNNKLFSINTQKNKNEKVIQSLASFEFLDN